MFFALSKIVDVLAAPLTWALLLVTFGVVRLRSRWPRRRVHAAVALAAAVVVLWTFSLGAVANRLWRSLEASATDTTRPDVTYDAVIVLGGVLSAEATESSGRLEYNEAVERLLTAFDLLRSGRVRYALITGGVTDSRVKDAVEARVLAKQLEDWGIAEDRLVVETESRTTRENAVFSERIVRSRGWKSLLLVTSAFHMERAAGCFRAAGLTFDTRPVDFRSYDPARFSSGWLPRVEQLAVSTGALHEYLGRVVYRVEGYTKGPP